MGRRVNKEDNYVWIRVTFVAVKKFSPAVVKVKVNIQVTLVQALRLCTGRTGGVEL